MDSLTDNGRTQESIEKMEGDAVKRGLSTMASGHGEKKEALQVHIDHLKGVLFDTKKAV